MMRFAALLICCLCLATPPALAEFAHTNPQDARVTHARLGRMIVESQTAEPNITIEYEEGYHNAAGDFVSLGVNHRLFIDEPEELAEDGTVITPADPEYSDLLALLRNAIGATDQTDQVEQHLATKIAEDQAEE